MLIVSSGRLLSRNCLGARSWVRRAVKIALEGEVSGALCQWWTRESSTDTRRRLGVGCHRLYSRDRFAYDESKEPHCVSARWRHCGTSIGKLFLITGLWGSSYMVQYIPRENNSARIYVRLPTDPAKVAADQTQSSASADSREKIMQVSEHPA